MWDRDGNDLTGAEEDDEIKKSALKYTKKYYRKDSNMEDTKEDNGSESDILQCKVQWAL